MRRARTPVIAGEPEALEAVCDDPVVDPSANADPANAHSPMSPDDRVSDQHVGLHTDGHSTTGTTPAS